MTIMRRLCASRSRSAPNIGTARPLQRNTLTQARESVLMVDIVDIAHGAVAIRFVSGYDHGVFCLTTHA